jgi:hypothetical protein
MNNSAGKTNFAKLTIASAVISLLCLLILHFVSPEFDPGWRMISEYALGNHEWLLTLFFVFWGAGSFFTILILWNMVTTKWAKFGVILICLSFIGQIMGGMFDIKHPLHGLAFLLGVPSLPIAALLVSYHLIKKVNWGKYKPAILFSAHFTWISLVLMAASMVLMISGFQKAGIPMGEGAVPPKSVPHGVIAVNGYANRILVFAYIYWLILIAKTYLKTETKKK